MNNNETKTVWNDISKVWGRIAAVIAAVGILATFVVQIFHTSSELTYTIFAGLGLVLLIISFYVDKQAEYTHQEVVEYERKARADFIEVMQKARQQTIDMKDDTNKKINTLTESIDKVLEVSQETRKDTLRIQLLIFLEHQPDNVDTILKLAELYFIGLKGDWYMTNEFTKWAKAHDVEVPNNIYQAMDESHKN